MYVSLNFLTNEGKAFRKCINVIQNFRTVNKTGHLLVVVVGKGGYGIAVKPNTGLCVAIVINPELSAGPVTQIPP